MMRNTFMITLGRKRCWDASAHVREPSGELGLRSGAEDQRVISRPRDSRGLYPSDQRISAEMQPC